MIELKLGDCIEVMREMDANSVDAIVTDPPYGLEFMGKEWDKFGGKPIGNYYDGDGGMKRYFKGNKPIYKWDMTKYQEWSFDWAVEALRVAKPGAHLLAFGGTRTFHRLACAIEDAGWEIRDTVMWVYGSGFPKSHDVSKAIDKINGESNRALKFTSWMRSTGMTAKRIDELTGTYMGSHYTTQSTQPAIPTPDLWKIIRPYCGDIPEWVDKLVERIEAEREVIGIMPNPATPRVGTFNASFDESKAVITLPSTPEAQEWEGWGTALKPAWEPILVCRKPLEGTVAANVLKWGTGAINIDGCRVGIRTENESGWSQTGSKASANRAMSGANYSREPKDEIGIGRWPANLIHDGSDEVLEGFPNDKGNSRIRRGQYGGGVFGGGLKSDETEYPDSGSAARFFYCAKSSKSDRNDGLNGNNNGHPTVKPTALMQYLCRLVTPPGGIILDPFMGSGSTGKAAILEGFSFIGIEKDAEYLEIAEKRIAKAQEQMRLPI